MKSINFLCIPNQRVLSSPSDSSANVIPSARETEELSSLFQEEGSPTPFTSQERDGELYGIWLGCSSAYVKFLTIH